MTFYFYDLETSGVNPKRSRIMQFAGQRTDETLQPVSEPDNFLIKLHPDVLPEPDAILLTGITPQRANADGLSEPEFLRFFTSDIATPDTVFLGFNTIRFGDEFMRYLHFRNYYDPYAWQWQDARGRWDLLDAVRMMRALRPEGLNWPVASDGSATNRLESLTEVNNIEHTEAHTALADVTALIALAQKMKKAQPKLFSYLLSMRTKQAVRDLVTNNELFVYTSGSLDGEHEKTTLAYCCQELPDKAGCVVYDARYPIEPWLQTTKADLAKAFEWQPDKPAGVTPPFKILQYNRCPAIAPISVLDADCQERISIDVGDCQEHVKQIRQHGALISLVTDVLYQRKTRPSQLEIVPDTAYPDAKLYDGFLPKSDEPKMAMLRGLDQTALASFEPDFTDERLQALWPLYKARSYPKILSSDERRAWERHIEQVLFSGESSPYARFLQRLQELAVRPGLTKNGLYILDELRLYGESLAPY